MTHKSNTDNPVDFPELETETNLRIRQLAEQAGAETWSRAPMRAVTGLAFTDENLEKFAELIVRECINREELLGAIARGWCSEKNSHKTMDPDLALAIFDEVERQIKQQFGIE
jgi:hypothetical protein